MKKVINKTKKLGESGSASEQKPIAPPPILRPIRVNNVKQARKLLSRLIYGLQKGEISGRTAKDLCYLLSVFISIVRETETEERITELERKAGISV